VRDWIKLGRVLTKSTTTLSGPLNTGARYFWAQLKLGLKFYFLLKTIADQNGCELLAARVHDGDYVHVFVSAAPKVYIPDLMCVFKCISAMVLFVEFPDIKK
jgi:hypothetical protein